MEKLNCEDAKRIDLVDYLAFLGHQPQRIKNNDYWYLSPLREERTPSFKVNGKLNVWYDHATGKGGDLVDFGTQYFGCSVGDFLKTLAADKLSFSFHQPVALNPLAGEKKDNKDSKIVIAETRSLKEKSLLEYLKQRNVSLLVAQQYCREVDFLLYGRQQTVIGFQNNAGGYELRSTDFKGRSSPKGITFISHNVSKLNVFEGFFNFLSFLSVTPREAQHLTNFLVLNSLSFFGKSRPLMEKHEAVNLYLDRDKAGMNCTQQALKWNRNLYNDRSDLYSGFKDFNEWLIKSSIEKQAQKHGLRPKRFF